MQTPDTVQVVSYREAYRADFARLNRAWIEAFFTLEAADHRVFADPFGEIVAPGGQIFFALVDGAVKGTCAVVRESASTYELAKMAVEASARGRGLGGLLVRTAIAFARDAGAEELVLSSNRKLETALRLYEKHGFRPVSHVSDERYRRADVRMRLALPKKGKDSMSDLQPRAHLRAFIELAYRRLAADLRAIPEDIVNVSPGGDARPALHIVAECATVNGQIAASLSTGAPLLRLSPEEREAHLRSFDTAEKALAFLAQETQKLLEAVDGLDESTLDDEVSREVMGRPITRFALAELPAGHMMYHDGQLNYIHTLHGDRQIHWNR